jgi:hypothetical protein
MAIDTPPSAAGVAARRAEMLATPRLAREAKTIAAMLRIWCRDHHGELVRNADRLCPECAGLLAYACKRLGHCPYGPAKPTCVHCPIHCYGKRQREQVRDVMRYAGPRMLTRHPWLAIAHLIDGRRPVPPRPGEGAHAAAAAPDNPAPRDTPSN